MRPCCSCMCGRDLGLGLGTLTDLPEYDLVLGLGTHTDLPEYDLGLGLGTQ